MFVNLLSLVPRSINESMIQLEKPKYTLLRYTKETHTQKYDHHDSDNMKRNQPTELMRKTQYGIDVNRDDNNN